MPIRAIPSTAGHLGQGVAWPLAYTSQGRLALSAGAQSVEDSLEAICRTVPGERVMQPTNGANLFVHEPFDPGRFELAVREAVANHEPRISAITSVDVTFGNAPDQAIVTIQYEIAGDASPRTLTYPLFVGPSGT